MVPAVLNLDVGLYNQRSTANQLVERREGLSYLLSKRC